MEGNNLIKKNIAVAVILLFIGLAFVPSINANISKSSIDSELVEFTTEVCGLDGGKHTVKLTREEAGEVETLFDSIRERLNATESREETVEIFKEAVVELDKYGLLGGLSIEQAQKLVTSRYQNSRVMKIKEGLLGGSQSRTENDSNLFCLLAGHTHGSNFLSLPLLISSIPLVITLFIWLLIFASPWNHPIRKWSPIVIFLVFLFAIPAFSFYFFSDFINPFPIGNLIFLGFFGDCNGWVHTFGLLGKKSYEGNLLGKIDRIFDLDFDMNLGIVGFTGLKLFLGFDLPNLNMHHFYLGVAPIVSIKGIG